MLYRTSDSYHLTGEDARELYNALISPSREQRERNAECMRCIDESIHLGESDDNGFNVIIDDLDLSFLDDSVEDYSFDVNSSMTIKKRQWPVEFTDLSALSTTLSILSHPWAYALTYGSV